MRARSRLRGYWFIPAITALAIVVWAWNAPIPIPKALDITPAILIGVFGTLAEVLAAIVGVSIAAILVALQVLRATYSSTVVREVLGKPDVYKTLSLYLAGIAISILGLVSVTSPLNPRSVALEYLALAIFFVCLVALPTAISGLVNLTRIDRKRIEALVSSVGSPSISRFIASQRVALEIGSPADDDDPLFVLGEVAIRALREHDRVLPTIVVHGVRDRLLGFFGTIDQPLRGELGQEWRGVINSFLTVLRPVAMTAVSVGDERTLLSVIYAIGAIQKEAGRRGLPWYSVHELNESLEAITLKSIETGSSRGAQVAIHVIKNTLVVNLTHNVASEEDLWEFNPSLIGKSSDESIEESNQWENVAHSYVAMLARIVKTAAVHGAEGAVSTGVYELGRISNSIRSLPNLGPKQKEEVIRQALWYAADALVTAVDTLGETPVLGINAFYSFHTIEDLTEGKPWAKQQVLQLCSVTRSLARSGRLDPFSLNQLGTAGRGAINKLTGDDTLAEAVTILAETIAAVAHEASVEKRSEFSRLICEAASQLASFEKWNKGNLKNAPHAWERVHTATEKVELLAKQYSDQPAALEWPSLAGPIATNSMGKDTDAALV